MVVTRRPVPDLHGLERHSAQHDTANLPRSCRAEFGWSNEQVTMPANMFFALVAFLNPCGRMVPGPFFHSSIDVDRNNRHNTLFSRLFPLVQTLVAPRSTLSCYLDSRFRWPGLSPSLMLLSRWFVRYRGLAFGILMMASSFGGAIFPWLVNYFLPNWRLAVMGACCSWRNQ